MKLKKRSKVKMVFGPPGTGKTSRMIEEVRTRLLLDADPDKMAYVAFTRKAAGEAVERIAPELNGHVPRNFRTIHSLAYRELGMDNGAVMDWADYQEIGKALNMRFTRWFNPEEAGAGGQQEGDRVRAVAELAAAQMRDPEDVLHEAAEDVDVWRFRRYRETLRGYKEDTGKIDFNDMLKLTLREVSPLQVETAVVDEAQDLSALQWAVVQHLVQNATEIFIAGDDDQAIFRWAGADVESFLALEAQRKVLSQSYRVPLSVQRIAQRIAARIKTRYPKDWMARDGEGNVERVGDPEDVDVTQPGTWLLLARNGYQLNTWRDVCRARGVTYSVRGRPGVKPKDLRIIRAWEALRTGQWIDEGDWAAIKEVQGVYPGSDIPVEYEGRQVKARVGRLPVWYDALTGMDAEDAAYYRVALRRGEDLDAPPRHNIHTIHTVKGGEADNVALLTDQSYRTAEAAETNPDDEHRVFYVAVTRARESLHLVVPQSDLGYTV